MGTIRKTQSIEILLAEFQYNSMAISVIELVKRLNEKLNKTTVYRVLDRLEDDGVLHSFLGAGGIKWYAKSKGCSSSTHTDIHPHFECMACGKMDCLDISLNISKITNREIITSHLLIQGKCDECCD